MGIDSGAARSSGQMAGSRLRDRVFYGIIVAGVVVGAVACAATGWAYLESSSEKPTGRRIWDGVADHFVVPICVMIGATFGGLLGLAAAIIFDFRARGRPSKLGSTNVSLGHSDSGIHSVTS